MARPMRAPARTGVHVHAVTSAAHRWFRCHVIGGESPIAIAAADGSYTVLREDRWAHVLAAAPAREDVS